MISTDRGLLPQQKENARHGESGFPIQRYRTTLHATYQDVPTHWHEEAELTLIVRGASTYTVQLDSQQVREGDIVFVPPRQSTPSPPAAERWSRTPSSST